MKRYLTYIFCTFIIIISGCGNGGSSDGADDASPTADPAAIYDQAKSEYDAGSYEDALSHFNSIGDYERAAYYIEACSYRLAVNKLEAGDYETAGTYLASVKSINTASQTNECNYQRAVALYNEGDMKEAAEILKNAPDYKDSSDYINEYAGRLLEEKKYDDVISLLQSCNNEKSQKIYKKAKQNIKYSNMLKKKSIKKKKNGWKNYGTLLKDKKKIEKQLEKYYYKKWYKFVPRDNSSDVSSSTVDESNSVTITKDKIGDKDYCVYAYLDNIDYYTKGDADDAHAELYYYYMDDPETIHCLTVGTMDGEEGGAAGYFLTPADGVKYSGFKTKEDKDIKKSKSIRYVSISKEKYDKKMNKYRISIRKQNYSNQLTERAVRKGLGIPADADIIIKYSGEYYEYGHGCFCVPVEVEGRGAYSGYSAGASFCLDGSPERNITMWSKY